MELIQTSELTKFSKIQEYWLDKEKETDTLHRTNGGGIHLMGSNKVLFSSIAIE